MTIDLALLRREAELLKQEWDEGQWQDAEGDSYPGSDFHNQPAKSNPGAVAERTIALIDAIESSKIFVQRDVECLGCGVVADRAFTQLGDDADVSPCPSCESKEGRFSAIVKRADWHGRIFGWTE